MCIRDRECPGREDDEAEQVEDREPDLRQDPAEQLHYAKIPASLQQIDELLLQQVQGGS